MQAQGPAEIASLPVAISLALLHRATSLIHLLLAFPMCSLLNVRGTDIVSAIYCQLEDADSSP